MRKNDQKQETKEIPAPKILVFMVQQLNNTAYEKEAALQCEESGTNVARLQGYLAGVRRYKQIIRESGYTLDAKYDDTTERKLSFFDENGCTIKLQELRETVSDIDEMTGSTAYENFKDKWQKAVETRKDWLFYTSEKGRDLHFAKGWYEAMKEIDDTITRLHKELEAAEKEAAESLPFDDTDDGTDDIGQEIY